MNQKESDADVVIVGGGVVGLSCAYELAARGRSVILLERHARMGEETSTHNSGVIHAGIYYPPGSLKAKLCVRGCEILTRRLPDWGVAHRICGKLIVAVEDSEIPVLETLLANGLGNGVSDLELISAADAKKIEPNVRAAAALRSPSTGVFDAGEYIRVLEGRAQAAGASMIAGARVVGVEKRGGVFEIRTEGKGSVAARAVVNAAGLDADAVARLCGDARHTIHPCRGEYAVVVPRRAGLIRGLVYPIPGMIDLGVHLTKTVHGELWLGPDAKYIESKTDYESRRRAPEDFFPEARRLCPSLRKEDLRMGPSGIRAKRVGPNERTADFLIEPQPGEPAIIHLVGIESPGLTASPAIAGCVAQMMEKC